LPIFLISIFMACSEPGAKQQKARYTTV